MSLSVDGVARGEVYLEMTYYSHVPVPNTATQLAAPTAGVMKRPSKLAPADRLSRPPQSPLQSSTQKVESQKRQGQPDTPPIAIPRYLGAPSSSSPSPSGAPHKRPESPLPPLPQVDQTLAPLPDALLPGSAVRKKRNGGPLSLQQVLSDPYVSPSPNLPSTLRPGIQTGRRVPSGGSNITSQTPSTALPQAVPYRYRAESDPYGSPSPNLPSTLRPAIQTGHRIPSDGSNIAPRILSTSLPQVPQAVPYDYPTESGPGSLGLSYPRPPGQFTSTNAIAVPLTVPYPPPSSLPPIWAGGEPARPVTFPIAMTPPPLEINSSYSILERPVARRPIDGLPDPYLQARYQTPLPLPPGHSDNQSHTRQSPSQPVRASADRDRIEAIRLAEGEAARRKEQANKDLELALQLDRELNVDA